jgi:hypothetical protein
MNRIFSEGSNGLFRVIIIVVCFPVCLLIYIDIILQDFSVN